MAVRRRIIMPTRVGPPSGERFSWHPYYVIICDDMRREENGKEILIGVYNEEIIAARFPAVIISAVFRVAVHQERDDFKTARILVKNPDGTTMFDVSQPIMSQTRKIPCVYSFGMVTPTFATAGSYEINFSLDDEMRTVGSLRVRPPDTEDEKRRSGANPARGA
jgi:hypothetical protein